MYEKEFDCNPKFSLCGNYRFFIMYTLAKEYMLQLEQHINIFKSPFSKTVKAKRSSPIYVPSNHIPVKEFRWSWRGQPLGFLHKLTYDW